jgi:hypothetical protein
VKKATELHAAAMSLADEADAARRKNHARKASQALVAAFKLEREAALLVSEEPSRSVLLRSAASLALEAGKSRDAEQCVALALSGSPPDEIAEELRDLLEQIHFHRHLDVRGVTLEDNEFQLSIYGESTGFGVAPSDDLTQRIEYLQKMILRTAERKSRVGFRDTAGSSKEVKREFQLYLSVPRAASMAVTFRLARPSRGNAEQQLMFAMEPREVVTEVLDCLSLLNEGKENVLEQRIGDEAYFRNFVALAKQIAPDGTAIRLVGFTAGDGLAREQRVEFKRLAKSIVPSKPGHTDAATTTYQGRLLFADHRPQRQSVIQIVEDGGNRIKIRVPESMMADIVRPMWGRKVIVTCLANNDRRTLIDIDPISDDDEAKKS